MSDRDDAEWEAAPDDPRSEHRILRDDFTEAWDTTEWDPPNSAKRAAILAYVCFLERRTRQLEVAIESYLKKIPADALRAELLAQIYGTRQASARDLNLLTKTERRLINQYTRMANDDRALFRLLVKRLAENYDNNDDDNDGGSDGPVDAGDPQPQCSQPVGTGGAR
jgi:hypothetical protein